MNLSLLKSLASCFTARSRLGWIASYLGVFSAVWLRADDPNFYLFSPPADAAFTAPATIPVAAVAIDNGQSRYGRIVKFYANDQLIGTSDRSKSIFPAILPLPVVHEIKWTKVAAGDYEIVAVATRFNPPAVDGIQEKSAALKVHVGPTAPPKVWLEAHHTQITEGKSSDELRLSRSGSASAELVVDITFTGTATPGTDYVVTPDKYVFKAGSDRLTIGLQTKADTLAENDETVIVSVVAPPTDGNASPKYQLGEPASVKLVIKDPPPPNQPPEVKIDSAETITRGPGDITSLNAIASDPDGSVELVSFVLDGRRIWSDANPPFSVTIGSLALGTHSLYAVATDNRSATTVSSKIQINVVAGTGLSEVLLTTDDGTALETDPSDIMKFTLSRNGDLKDALRVFFKVGGTAKQDVDYNLISEGAFLVCPACAQPASPPLGNYVDIPAGQVKVQFGARALPDGLNEGAETLSLTLIQPPDLRDCINCPPLPPAYSINPHSGAKGLIYDEAPALHGSVKWSRPGSDQRFDAPADIKLEVLASVNGALIEKVEFYANDILVGKAEVPLEVSDHTVDAGTALRFGIIWHDVVAGNYALKAIGISGANRFSSVIRTIHVITPPELPVITVEATRPTTSEPNPVALIPPVDFVLKRTGPTDKPIKVYYSVAGTARNGRDYTFLDGDATIAAGKLTREIRLQPLTDKLKEADETVILKLRANRAYRIGDPNNATVTIQDVPPDVEPPTTATIEFIQPKAGEHFPTAAEVPIKVTTKDPGGYFPEIEFLVDGVSIGTSKVSFIREPDPGTPVDHLMAWKNPAVGVHKLTARGKSSRGVEASAEITVTVEAIHQDPTPIAHPADLPPGNFVLTADEVGAYAGSWKKGLAWSLPPNPIPVAYLTRAGFLFQSGGAYAFDSTVATAPLFWIPGISAPTESILIDGSTDAVESLDPLADSPAADPPAPAPVNAALAEIAGISATTIGELKIHVTLAPQTKAWAVEETVGTEAVVGDISEGGLFDAGAGIIRWGPFLDAIDRTLTAKVLRDSPLRMIGVASFDGVDQRIPHQLTPPPLPLAASGEMATPRIASVTRLDSGAVQLLIVDDAGSGGDVEASADLSEWEKIGQTESGQDSSTHLDTDAGETRVRFYRVVRH